MKVGRGCYTYSTSRCGVCNAKTPDCTRHGEVAPAQSLFDAGITEFPVNQTLIKCLPSLESTWARVTGNAPAMSQMITFPANNEFFRKRKRKYGRLRLRHTLRRCWFRRLICPHRRSPRMRSMQKAQGRAKSESCDAFSICGGEQERLTMARNAAAILLTKISQMLMPEALPKMAIPLQLSTTNSISRTILTPTIPQRLRVETAGNRMASWWMGPGRRRHQTSWAISIRRLY